MAIDLQTAPHGTLDEQDRVVLDLSPLQGSWSEEQYLGLTDYTRRLIEFTDGYIEVLPMPTDRHQSILQELVLVFLHYLKSRGGKVLFAPLRLHIRSGKFREPDILLVQDANDPRRQNRFWQGADLVLEVVSEDDPDRDLVDKRAEYAEARIPEYWIVNPQTETITVLQLVEDQYAEHGVFVRGTTATSVLLPEFVVDVDAAFDAD